MLFRHIVMMLRPEVFLSQVARPRTTADGTALVAQLCDYMCAHLDEGLTLPDLEAFSGLSARSLQLAFIKHLDCTQALADRAKTARHSRQTPEGRTFRIGYIPGGCLFSKFGRLCSLLPAPIWRTAFANPRQTAPLIFAASGNSPIVDKPISK
jgi:hypothetical protein